MLNRPVNIFETPLIDTETAINRFRAEQAAKNADDAAKRLALPRRTIIVDWQYRESDVEGQEGTIQEALITARAILALSPFPKVIIHAYLDEDGDPIAIPAGESLSALFDEGIIFTSPFDTWENWKTFGGILDVDKLLYQVDLDRSQPIFI